jgi:teichuronic acid biosynthesis glycosyltransferase TuaC
MKVLMVTNQYRKSIDHIGNPVVNRQVKELEKLGCNITVLYINKTEYGYLAYIKFIFKLISLKYKKSFDIIHVQFGGLQAFITSLIFQKKSIVSFHGTDLHGGSPKGIFQSIKSKVNVFFSLLSAYMSGMSILVSKNLAKSLPAKIKYKIIPTGVDYKLFFPLPMEESKRLLNLDPKKIYVLFSDISNSPIKRKDIAISIVEKVIKKIGCAELLIMSNVKPEDVVYYLNASSVLLLTSDNEGSPNIIKEALACNLPVVSADVGDISEYISSLNYCYAGEREVNTMSNAIIKIFEQDMSEDYRSRMKDKISSELIGKRIKNCYIELLCK